MARTKRTKEQNQAIYQRRMARARQEFGVSYNQRRKLVTLAKETKSLRPSEVDAALRAVNARGVSDPADAVRARIQQLVTAYRDDQRPEHGFYAIVIRTGDPVPVTGLWMPLNPRTGNEVPDADTEPLDEGDIAPRYNRRSVLWGLTDIEPEEGDFEDERWTYYKRRK